MSLIDEIQQLATDVMHRKIDLNNALNSIALDTITEKLDEWRALMEPYRTAKLWIQYQTMVSILRSFIRSVRIGDWNLYVDTLCAMQPYLAASGHNNYTKSLALFIPKMKKLEQTHPEVYHAFSNGLFPVRRSDGVWSGIFTDLYIEQVLMAGVKSTGGLTHGRGFS